MATTHTVVKGDTLWALAKKYNTTVNNLVKLNNITDPDYIVVGQVLVVSGNAVTVKKNTTSRANVTVFGLQSNTDRTVYATWTWDKSNTQHYQVKWCYDTGDGVWFVGDDTTTTNKQSLYTAPANAVRVKFNVKPVSKTRTVNKKQTSYWTASWSTTKTYSFSANPPTTPPVPTVSIKDYTLTAELDNLDVNATSIQFQIVRNDSSVFKTGTAAIKTAHASYSCTVTAGSEYKVRCRAVRGKLYSDWSQYSANAGTIPSVPSRISVCKAASETSVYVEWPTVKNATSYDLEFATSKSYFEGSDKTTTVSGITTTQYEKTGLTAGDEYFFRVRAVNDKGSSGWSAISSTVIGEGPAAPTTWSSTTTAIVGESLILYWVHNTRDGSDQTKAEVEITVDGVVEVHTVDTSDEAGDGTNAGSASGSTDSRKYTYGYNVQTTNYEEGTKLQWRVRTAGITGECGDWSIQRTVDIYAPPTLELTALDSTDAPLEVLTAFPIKLTAIALPNTQQPISYHVAVIANESYETVDNVGGVKMVNAGESVYSEHVMTSEVLSHILSAHNISLENNVSYTIMCTVSLDSGLTAEASSDFTVAWTDEILYEPNAEIAIDTDTYTASIRPYCEDEDGVPIDGVTLSVYRREFDGRFVELATGIDNLSNTFITDPHPALDYARYRVVAMSTINGAVCYGDVSAVSVGGKSILIQWDEDWTKFETTSEDALEQPVWSGSMLKLPYNIDVSESTDKDVALVKYIGRQQPVSYYGTQLGESAVWNATIEKSDVDTICQLRQLAIWPGDVYVREPSGTGYWANVSVSFNQKHRDLTIPVTINVTRVEGGV